VITRGDIRWFRFGSPDKRRPVLVLGKPDVLPSLNQVRDVHCRGAPACQKQYANQVN